MCSSYLKRLHEKRVNFITLEFFLLGIATLLPWNVFISAVSYFELRFCGSLFSGIFSNLFSFGFSLFSIFGLLVCLKYGVEISQKAKIALGLLALFVVFCLFFALSFVGNIQSLLFFILCMLSLGLVSMAGAVLESGAVGLANRYPSDAVQAVLIGQALVGLVVTVINLISVWQSNEMVESALESCPGNTIDIDSTSDEKVCSEYEFDEGIAAYFMSPMFIILIGLLGFYLTRPDKVIIDLHQSDSFLEPEAEDNTDSVQSLVGTRDISHGQASLYFCQCFIFVITMSLFPALASSLQSKQLCDEKASIWNTSLFVPLIFVIFNLADFLGRSSSGMMKSIITNKILVFMTLMRTLLIPCLLLCDIRGSKLPKVFNSDFWPIFFIVSLGFSNGYLTCRFFMAVSDKLPVHLQDRCGTLMVLSLITGVFIGSVLSFPIHYISSRSL